MKTLFKISFVFLFVVSFNMISGCKKKQELEGNYKVLEGKWQYRYSIVAYQDVSWNYHRDSIIESGVFFIEFKHKGEISLFDDNNYFKCEKIFDATYNKDDSEGKEYFSFYSKKSFYTFSISSNGMLSSQSFPFTGYFEPKIKISGKDPVYNNYFEKIN